MFCSNILKKILELYYYISTVFFDFLRQKNPILKSDF